MYDCVTSINDLSDNGKSFEFGYNSTDDTYGYYKDGVFTEFGGGGGLSTLCIVKSCVIMKTNINGTNSYAACINDDGSFTSHVNTTSSFMEMVDFIKANSDIVQNMSYTGNFNVTSIVAKKAGFYVWLGQDSTGTTLPEPTFVNAGSTINKIGNLSYNSFSGILYLGIEIPN